MSRTPRIALFVLGLIVVSFLPLYVMRTMTRSYMMDGGDLIEYGWALGSLHEAWRLSRFAIAEQQPGLWRAVNLGLAGVYAGLFTLGAGRLVDRARRWRQRRAV